MRPLVLALILVGCAPQATDPPAPFPGGTLIDLTHAFDTQTPYWPTADGFEMEIDFRGMTDGGYWYEANTIRTAEHGGTHLDAPVHFAEGKHSTEEIPLERLVAPAVMLDVSEQAAANPDYLVSVADLEAWENEHGAIPDGHILLVRTGFARFWPDRTQYMGTADRGQEATADLHFPGLDPEAARWLVANRSIAALGIDTASIDYGQSTDFQAHRVLFAENIPAFENVGDLSALPPVGFSIAALPMKIVDGSGGPLRIVAIVQ
ncbi:MAG: cyclase family protein [Rhodothermales bacterium]|nr:cyclase family protein [Rhodothermales bacterium]